MPYGISHLYQSDGYISNLRVDGRYFFQFHSNLKRTVYKKTVKTPIRCSCSAAASELGLHYLPMSYKKNAGLIRVKCFFIFSGIPVLCNILT